MRGPFRELAGEFRCMDVDLLCRIYGCTPDELEAETNGAERKLYWKDWNIAYEHGSKGKSCLAYYGNPFYDFFSMEGGVQWTNKEQFWKQDERKYQEFTPEEQILILNALTEIMHWREMPGHAKYLKAMSRRAFEGPDAERFQNFLREREKNLLMRGKW
jgi:hypothetical protein